jgi:epsin
LIDASSQPQFTGLQPQFTAVQPQFTSNPWQQAQQETVQAQWSQQQAEWLRQQQELQVQQEAQLQLAQQQQAQLQLAQQQQAQLQLAQQQEEWLRQQQQQQLFLQQQQQQQQQQMFLQPQQNLIPQPTGFGSNNPFALSQPVSSPSPTPFSPSQPNSVPNFNLPGTFENRTNGMSPSPRPSPASQATNLPKVNPQKGPTRTDKEHAHLASLLANADDGVDTFGNYGQLRCASNNVFLVLHRSLFPQVRYHDQQDWNEPFLQAATDTEPRTTFLLNITTGLFGFACVVFELHDDYWITGGLD